MAAQRKQSGRGGSGRPSSGGTRQAGAGRSGASSTRQRPSRAATNATGNGAPSAKSQATGNSAATARSGASARSATPANPARPASAVASAAPASGLVSRILAPFRTIGPVPLTTFILSLYALGASVYLTITHYDTNVTLACSDKGLVNCVAVTTSPQSMVFGIFPVAVIGLAYYVFMTALNSPWLWQLQQAGSDQISTILRYLRLGTIVAGMGFVLYLIYAELIQIRAICLWCTSVHVATFLIFALIVFYTSLSPRGQARPGRG